MSHKALLIEEIRRLREDAATLYETAQAELRRSPLLERPVSEMTNAAIAIAMSNQALILATFSTGLNDVGNLARDWDRITRPISRPQRDCVDPISQTESALAAVSEQILEIFRRYQTG